MTPLFAHIVNPVIVKPSSDLFAAQPITFETMRTARDFCRDQFGVQQFSCQFSEDSRYAPPFLTKTEDLTRSVLDVATFKHPRKLPLIRDVLDRLYSASNATYFVYTNVDIALMPHFYVALGRLLEQGFDALVINRRSVSPEWSAINDIPLMYSDIGKKHPGWDCFAFRKETYPSFSLGDVCIGANYIGRALACNLAATAKKFAELTDLHLTFHVGDNRSWRVPRFSDYDGHNRKQLIMALQNLEARIGKLRQKPEAYRYASGIPDSPWASTPNPSIRKRFFRWLRH